MRYGNGIKKRLALPNLSSDERAFLLNHQRSAAAAEKAYSRAAEWEASKPKPDENELALWRVAP